MRRPLYALLTVLAVLAVAPAAQASSALSVRYSDGAPAVLLQTWVDTSHVPLAAGSVTIHREPCGIPGAPPRACIAFGGADIWLGGTEPQRMRAEFSHELGHRFDYLVMTDRARDAFRTLVHDPRPWRTAPNSPHEKFAEAYGLCLRHRTIRRAPNNLSYGYEVNATRHRRVCRMIRQTAVGVFS